jgi:hypothetical protein
MHNEKDKVINRVVTLTKSMNFEMYVTMINIDTLLYNFIMRDVSMSVVLKT